MNRGVNFPEWGLEHLLSMRGVTLHVDEAGQPEGRKRQRESSPRPCSEASGPPRPLSFAVFVDNKPMTEADSIIRDPNVAVEFARKIFPPEVQ